MFKRYYALTKPGIIYGNLLTTAAGFLFASKLHLQLRLFVAVLLGTALVIAAACVFNNYIDRGIDQKMARTKKRALVSGTISVRSAVIFGCVVGIIGFVLLVAYANWLVVGVGAAAFIDYVVLYGIAKRRSVHGTIVGSISGAAPVVAGYTAVTDRLDGGTLLLFLILVCWQMPHFYAIAMYRYEDYKAADLPVLPVRRGMQAAKVQILLYIVAFLGVIIALRAFGYAGYTFLVVMLLVGLVWLGRGLQGFRAADDKAWARQMFFFSLVVILALSIMLSIGSRLR